MPRFFVTYTFHGRTAESIDAASLAEAEAAIEARVNSDDFDIDADEIDDVDFTVREMHPVTRNGAEMWSTMVLPGDVRGHASALTTAPLFGGPLEVA